MPCTRISTYIHNVTSYYVRFIAVHGISDTRGFVSAGQSTSRVVRWYPSSHEREHGEDLAG
jgi:hypothetical protein